jgi:hypothetical protein
MQNNSKKILCDLWEHELRPIKFAILTLSVYDG